jgi:hypothetical protein
MTYAKNVIILTTGKKGALVHAVVPFHHHKFTPKDAKEAALKAFGHTSGVTAVACGVSYRITPSGIRKTTAAKGKQ